MSFVLHRYSSHSSITPRSFFNFSSSSPQDFSLFPFRLLSFALPSFPYPFSALYPNSPFFHATTPSLVLSPSPLFCTLSILLSRFIAHWALPAFPLCIIHPSFPLSFPSFSSFYSRIASSFFFFFASCILLILFSFPATLVYRSHYPLSSLSPHFFIPRSLLLPLLYPLIISLLFTVTRKPLLFDPSLSSLSYSSLLLSESFLSSLVDPPSIPLIHSHCSPLCPFFSSTVLVHPIPCSIV